jgi:cold shock CspA family protein
MKKFAAYFFLFLFQISMASALMLEGTVQKIDRDQNVIFLNTESGTETVLLTNSTKGAENLKPGDKVRVTYRQEGGRLLAETITPNKGGSPPSPSEIPGA